MNRPGVRQFLRYASRYRGWRSYLRSPGDGRVGAQIPAAALLRALLATRLLRQGSFLAVEALVRSPARCVFAVRESFGDDALGYFTERLAADPLRVAARGVVRQAKRNKKKEIIGYRHHVVMASVVGTRLALPSDVEPYGPGDSEYSAGQRLLRRTLTNLGRRFADYAVVDGGFATAPFLHAVGDEGLKVVARLKGNLPELHEAAQRRFTSKSPDQKFQDGGDRVEIWDGDDFDPRTSLRWETVRVVFYRQHKPDRTVVEAYWLTDFT